MTKTPIGWTDYSANLLKYRDAQGKNVWACAKVSDGCKNCYSESMAMRFKRGGPFSLQQVRKVTPFFDIHEANAMLRAAGRKLKGQRIFIDDMSDLFGAWVSDEIIDKHFALFALMPDTTFQILTKRAERLATYLDCMTQDATNGSDDEGDRLWCRLEDFEKYWPDWPVWTIRRGRGGLPFGWPLQKVWCGTSCEDQQRADERIPHLIRCPAVVRFLSVEPLLAPVELAEWVPCAQRDFGHDSVGLGIHWVIIGAESGPRRRPCRIEWIESIVEQCKAAGVPAFVKQIQLPNGRVTTDINDFPPHLQVQQFPQSKALEAAR